MIKATIDLTNCQYLGEFHQRIKNALDFPDGYGESWAAFKDMLTADCPFDYEFID